MRPIPLLVAGMGAALLGASGMTTPRLVWNTTASAPLGLYWVARSPRPELGEWVFVRPEGLLATWLDRRGFLPAGAFLLKRIAAVSGDRLCWLGGTLQINRDTGLPLRTRDRLGGILAHPTGCRDVAPGAVLLIAPDRRSLDSRYFGPTPVAWIVGRARPLWTWSAR